MRISRLFVDAPLVSDSDLSLGADAATYLGRVLRVRTGESIVLFDGRGGEYIAKIVAVNRRVVDLRVGAYVDVSRESPLSITLLQGLARGERMDFVVQKATELGVSTIVPVDTARAGVTLDAARREKRRQHWHGIAVAAAQQSGRTRVPTIEPITTLDEAVARLTATTVRLVADTTVGQTAWPANHSKPVAVAVGPEGGFADSERQSLAQKGFLSIRLGPRVLRTETAGLTAVAVVQSRYGDLHNDGD
ncbi:MAG: 16S rRNA (uracil(1498)-N(3))-methyltransferase [Pseudomonadota bacterium]